MPENKGENKSENTAQDAGTIGRSLTDVQLDDFDVDRQRERLERSRPDNLQSGQQQDQKDKP